MGVQGAFGSLAVALVIFGFAPGAVLSLIVRLFPKDDPRRRELQAELYAVPRWERPFWVCEQFEVALRTGVAPEVTWWWGRLVWHRAKLDCGLDRHREHPGSFSVPSDDEKAELQPGDSVKLMWSVKRSWGERMWVTITHRDDARLVGELGNWPLFVHMNPGEKVKFHIDDIIDCLLDSEDDTEQVA